MISEVITALYYIMVAYVVVFMILNLMRAKSWEREVLYVIVLLPFLLRLLRLK